MVVSRRCGKRPSKVLKSPPRDLLSGLHIAEAQALLAGALESLSRMGWQ